MSISFDRNRTQVEYEALIGISSPDEHKRRKNDFVNYALKDGDIILLQSTLKDDAADFFYNGIISFTEGIDSIFQKRFSWATVKLYYSIFYMLRASMASKGIALLQCMSMFRLFIRAGEKPFNTGNSRYKSTHQGTISHYKDLFSGDDKLLSNKIDDKDAYEWMQDVREIVNYRAVSFKDPDYLDVWDNFSKAIDDNTIGNLLLTLQDDPEYVLCLQEEYAVVGIPIKCIQKTIEDFINTGIMEYVSRVRIDYAKEVFQYSSRELKILESIFRE